MKKGILLVFILGAILILSGCTEQTTEVTTSESEETNNNTNPVMVNENTNTVTEETNTNKETDKACAWIDASDVVIELDLPEEYAHYNDETIFPSYEVGFLFKGSYGDTVRSVRLAQKGCDYRVGFSQADFAGLNMTPNYPLVVYGESGTSKDFTYENEPIKITLGEDNLPTQGSLFTLKVTGETNSYNHFDAIFK